MKLSPDQIAELVTRYGFADPRTAVAVVLGESGGDTRAENRKNRNGSIDRGLWQINSVHVKTAGNPEGITVADMFDVDASTAFALRLSSGGSDFNPWAVTRSDRWPELYAQAGRVKVPGSERSPGVGDLVGSVPYVGDAVGNVVGAVGSIASPFAGLASLAAKALAVLTSGDFWRRAAYAAAGLALLYLGLAAIFGRQAVGLGITAASKGTVNGSALVADDQDDDE